MLIVKGICLLLDYKHASLFRMVTFQSYKANKLGIVTSFPDYV